MNLKKMLLEIRIAKLSERAMIGSNARIIAKLKRRLKNLA